MIIGIDGNEANVEKQVGVSVYSRNLLTRFAAKATADTRFKVYLRAKPVDGMPVENEFFTYVIVPGPVMWTRLFLPAHLYLSRGIDVFFSPAHYAPAHCPVPMVVTIHDLAYFYFPNEFLKKDLYKLKAWTESSVKRARHLIAVSKTTKKDIIKFYGIDQQHISVVYNGFEKDVAPEGAPWTDVSAAYGIEDKKYVLYVGTLQPRKNIALLIRSFGTFKNEHRMKLVIVGKKGWMYDDILKEAERYGLRESVIFTDYIPDDSVVTLYRHAFCFVMPSLYEGFGIPVLEAMSQSCPVISSFASSLPEVGGDACLYFDPHNDKELSDKIVLLSKDASLRKSLVQEGKQRITQFSWDTCAEQTLEVIRSAAE